MTPDGLWMARVLAAWLYTVPLLGRYIAWSTWARRQREVSRECEGLLLCWPVCN